MRSSSTEPRLAKALLALALGFAGCASPFSTRSAYDSQRDLCAPAQAEAFAAEVDACLAAASQGVPCGGVVSYTGRLEGQPLTVESRTSSTVFGVVLGRGAGPDRLDFAEASGASPYFFFTLKLRSLGGATDQVFTTPRTLQLDGAAESAPNPLADDRFWMPLRLSAGGASVEYAGLTASGTLELQYQSATELSGTFSGSFGSVDDHLTGCFHFFETRVEAM